LSNESKELGSTTFELRHTKVAISNVIGVARPSVSRELKNMAEDQLIKISGRNIELLNTSVFNL
jgi:CRP-like cAMP-binding protein